MQRVTSGVGGTFQSSSAVDLGRRGGRDQTRRISKCAYLRGGGTHRPGRKGREKIIASLARAIENMAGSSLEAVKKKIKSLQEQADVAEDRASLLQRELNQERSARESVSRR